MAVFTLCFAGTDCWPDESLVDRSNSGGSNPNLYGPAGYIPAKVYADITGGRQQGKAMMPGPGAPYLHYWRSLWVPCTVKNPTGGMGDSALGTSMWDIAGHAAAKVVGVPSMGRGSDTADDNVNVDIKTMIRQAKDKIGVRLKPGGPTPPSSKRYQFSPAMLQLLLEEIQPTRDGGQDAITTINLIGHSRGGVAAIMCAHELEYLFPYATLNIFAIDPVPGPFTLSIEMVKLAGTVKNYVGVYAVDETSNGFNGVVPWCKYNGSYIDPLELTEADDRHHVPNYHLIYAPGRHGTVAGNRTKDGDADLTSHTSQAGMVGRIVDHLARACLRNWGTNVPAAPNSPSLAQLKRAMTDNAALYRDMRNTNYPTGPILTHWRERGITSAAGSDPEDWHYLEDAIGAEPLVARVSRIPNFLRSSRPDPGRVLWQKIQSIPDGVFRNGKWDND